jgi:Sulfotransferase family
VVAGFERSIRGKPKPREGVVVLGMHRSGTSAATRLINTLGLATCEAHDFVRGPWNPTGHWESRTLALLDDQLLAEMGRTWWYPPPAGESYREAAGRIVTSRPRARRIFHRVHRRSPWVWKDPRACLVLPFWREALGERFAVVLVVRNPLEVATSLNRRHGTPMSFGVALWERYNRLALDHLNDMPVIVSDFEEVVNDPVQWVATVRDFLVECGLAGIEASDAGEVRRFVNPGLRHTVDDRVEKDEIGRISWDLYDVFDSIKGASSSFVPPALPPEPPSVEAELERFGPDHEPFWVAPDTYAATPAPKQQSPSTPRVGAGPSWAGEHEAIEPDIPNLFIVGAPCSNTAALAAHLGQHSEIFVAPGELNYFGTDLTLRNRKGSPWHMSRDEYLARFSGSDHARYRCDRSDFYLYSQLAAAEIAQSSPGARIIAILRNPVEQMYSQHRRMLFQGEEDIGDFAEALGAEEERKQGRRIPDGCRTVFGLFYRDLANYHDQLERFMAAFGRERICVVIHDDLVSDPVSTYPKVFAFLGLDRPAPSPSKVVSVDMEVRSRTVRSLVSDTRVGTKPRLRRLARMAVPSPHTRAALRRRLARTNTRRTSEPSIDPVLRRRLQGELSAQIEKLEQLLGRNLGDWHTRAGAGT